jgi:methyl-accepting chemotaxis protein
MSRWIANLSLRNKCMLLGVFAFLMALVPATLVITSVAKNWQVLRLEQDGLRPANAVLTLIKLSQEHRGLSASVLAGNEGKKAQRAERKTQVDAAYADAIADLRSLGDDKLLKEAEALQRDWAPLAHDVETFAIPPSESGKRHTALVNRQLTLLEDLTDATGLALDAESESYHLIMAAYRDWPRASESLGLARALGATMIFRNSRDDTETQRLIGLLESGSIHAKDALRAIAKSEVEAQAGEEKLRDAVAAAKKGMDTAAARVQAIVKADDLAQFHASEYFDAMTAVITTQYHVGQVVREHLEARLDARVAQGRRQLTWTVGLLLVLAAGFVSVATIITRVTSSALGEALRQAQAIASGDLSVTVQAEQRDEIGQLMRAMNAAVVQLRDLIGGIKSASDSVATASGEIAQGNLDLSARTENQASSLQETASSMEQMSATVRQNAATAQTAHEMATRMAGEAHRSGSTFAQVVSKMDEIREASRRIADINTVIDGIAFQTNILALNAAVEAARAGEQGRGFAVVASEVRTLAQRSAQAAREIKTLIQRSADTVDQGHELASGAAGSIQSLVDEVQRVSALMSDIATGSEQQNLGISQVNQAVSQLDQTTQQNAALVEQSSAAAASLSDQATRLQQSVSGFRLS